MRINRFEIWYTFCEGHWGFNRYRLLFIIHCNTETGYSDRVQERERPREREIGESAIDWVYVFNHFDCFAVRYMHAAMDVSTEYILSSVHKNHLLLSGAVLNIQFRKQWEREREREFIVIRRNSIVYMCVCLCVVISQLLLLPLPLLLLMSMPYMSV